MRVTSTITIDAELRDKAKRNGINISGFLEKRLREALGAEESFVEPEAVGTCPFCGIQADEKTFLDEPADSFGRIGTKCPACSHEFRRNWTRKGESETPLFRAVYMLFKRDADAASDA